MTTTSWWSAGDGGLTVFVRVTAGTRTTEIVDVTEGRLRVRVAAPAREGKANTELRRFLAKRFGVRPSKVTLVRGERSREKTLWIDGVGKPPPDLGGAA